MTDAADHIFTGTTAQFSSEQLARISTAYFMLALLTTTLMFC